MGRKSAEESLTTSGREQTADEGSGGAKERTTWLRRQKKSSHAFLAGEELQSPCLVSHIIVLGLLVLLACALVHFRVFRAHSTVQILQFLSLININHP